MSQLGLDENQPATTEPSQNVWGIIIMGLIGFAAGKFFGVIGILLIVGLYFLLKWLTKMMGKQTP